MGLLPACLTKTAYYLYCYCATIMYYCLQCPVKEQEVNKILSYSDQTVIIAMDTEEELKKKPVEKYHRELVVMPGTMQSRIRNWKKKHTTKPIPFEQWYRLLFLHKVLTKEQKKLEKVIIDLKYKAIKTSLEKFINIKDLLSFLTEEIMELTYSPTDQYQSEYCFLKKHYVRLSKLVRISYDYTPCYYLLLSILAFFQWLYLIDGVLGEIAARQLTKRPLKLYSKPYNYKSFYHYLYLETVEPLGKEIGHQLSLCSNLQLHSMTMAGSTPLRKALINQNHTAIELAIVDPFFHGIQQNNQQDYTSIPFIGSWMLEENKGLPLTNTRFCEQALFAPDWLVDHIYNHIKIELQHNLDYIRKKTYNQVQQDKVKFTLCIFPANILLVYNFFREHFTDGDYPTYWPIGINQCLLGLLAISVNICNYFDPPFEEV